jgi:hydrogenase nickel incorporation protein HypB
MSQDTPSSEAARTVKVEKKVLSKNDEIAAVNRSWLEDRGVVALNFISSPGTGKTLLLEKTLEALRGKVPCGVIVGDLQTDNDAKRMAGKGARVHQIETISSCHLDAARIAPLLPEVVGDDVKLLFIENVGNLVCPASYDLGESFKVTLLSTTEGEDKPVKYPVIFSRAKVVVITKMDLAPHVEWNRDRCLGYISQVTPAAKVFELSAKSGTGMEAWVGFLQSLVKRGG